MSSITHSIVIRMNVLFNLHYSIYFIKKAFYLTFKNIKRDLKITTITLNHKKREIMHNAFELSKFMIFISYVKLKMIFII